MTEQMYNGTPVKFCPEYKVQKKTSRFRIINWIYKKMYGFETKYFMPRGQIIYATDQLIMSRETFNDLENNKIFFRGKLSEVVNNE